MTTTDLTRLFFFIQSLKEMSNDLRWQMLSLMSYLPNCGVYDCDKREKPFMVHYSKLKEIFWIDKLDLFTLGDIYKFISYECANENTVIVKILWENIDKYRTEYLSNIKKSKPITEDVINQVLELIKSGQVKISQKV